MLRLKAVLHHQGIRQAELATDLLLSEGLVSQLLNHEQWPKRIKREDLEPRICKFMQKKGISDTDQARAFDSLSQQEHQEMLLLSSMNKLGIAPADDSEALLAVKPKSRNTPAQEPDEDAIMLIRKQNLTPAARRQFGLIGDLFGDVRSSDEVYLSSSIRYVRESMYSVARDGGFMAVVGESGSGKSTLRYDLHDRISREGGLVCVIEPYIIGMEDNDMKGKTLRAGHIAEAIMSTLAPHEKVSKSPETRFKQCHHALQESTRAGYNNVLLIEEAHSIPIPVLKHLKRFHELKDGFRSLLSIILIGQPELGQKLNERDPAVREVVQRCELVTLPPLDEELKPYLQARFKHRGLNLTDIMDDTAIEAVRTKLSGPPQRPGQRTFSLLYPLAVGNVITAALNAAAAYGIPKVTADLVREV